MNGQANSGGAGLSDCQQAHFIDNAMKNASILFESHMKSIEARMNITDVDLFAEVKEMFRLFLPISQAFFYCLRNPLPERG